MLSGSPIGHLQVCFGELQQVAALFLGNEELGRGRRHIELRLPYRGSCASAVAPVDCGPRRHLRRALAPAPPPMGRQAGRGLRRDAAPDGPRRGARRRIGRLGAGRSLRRCTLPITALRVTPGPVRRQSGWPTGLPSRASSMSRRARRSSPPIVLLKPSSKQNPSCAAKWPWQPSNARRRVSAGPPRGMWCCQWHRGYDSGGIGIESRGETFPYIHWLNCPNNPRVKSGTWACDH